MVNETSVSTILYYFEEVSPKFLLLKYNIYGQTHWDFIKGKIEKREKLEDTAKRETFEEANIERIKIVRGFKEKSTYNYQKNTGESVNKIVVYFLSEIPKERSREVRISEEHQDFKWATYNQARKLLEFPNQLQVLDKANSFIKARA